MASPTDGSAHGGHSATQEFAPQFLDNSRSQVAQPSEEPALPIPRTLSPEQWTSSPEQFSDALMSSPEQLPAAYTLPPYQVHEPTTASVNAVTADHATPPQHSTAGELWLYYVASSPPYAPSGSGPAHSTAHVSAPTTDHQHSTTGALDPVILLENFPPPQASYAISSPRYVPTSSGSAYTAHGSAVTADQVLAPRSAEHSYQPPSGPPPGPPPQSSYMVSSPQYVPPSSGPTYTPTANSAATEDHFLAPGPAEHFYQPPPGPPPQPYAVNSFTPYAPSSSGPAYAPAFPSHVSSVTADHALAPELGEHRYQPSPGPPPQWFYAVSSLQHALSDSGPANALASSGIYPSTPAGSSSLLTPTSQPSAVLSGEQHQEIVEESGLPMVDPNSEGLVGH
jgi:hypothetical protein